MVDYGRSEFTFDFPNFRYCGYDSRRSLPFGGQLSLYHRCKRDKSFWIATLLALAGRYVVGWSCIRNAPYQDENPSPLDRDCTLTGLYSINIKIMGECPTFSREIPTVFKQCDEIGACQNEEAVFLLAVWPSPYLFCLVLTFDETRLAWSCVRLGITFRWVRLMGSMWTTWRLLVTWFQMAWLLCVGPVCSKWWIFRCDSGTGTIVVGLSAVIIVEVLIHDLDHWRSLVIHRNWCHCLPFDYFKYLWNSKSRSKSGSSLL